MQQQAGLPVQHITQLLLHIKGVEEGMSLREEGLCGGKGEEEG